MVRVAVNVEQLLHEAPGGIGRYTAELLRLLPAQGVDVTPFTDQVKNGTTFLFPVTNNAADVVALMNPRMDAVYIGSAPVSSLTKLNKQLNDLFEVAE